MGVEDNKPKGQKSPLAPHRTRPWYPDILGHQQRGRKTGKKAHQQLEDRTEALKREFGLGDIPKHKDSEAQ